MRTPILFLFAALSLPLSAAPQTFSQAKRHLLELYTQALPQRSLYCACPFTNEGKRLIPDLDACGYQVRKQPVRANRIEWEHVMPAWQFGHQRRCWQTGGRRQCQKDDAFRRMEADLHNLHPAIGEVNGDRSNYRFTVWGEAASQYGQCEMVVDFKGRRAQPPMDSRGPIARAYLYMAEQYRIDLSDSQEKLYRAWHTMYPAQQDECHRHTLISERMGWPNPYISEQCNG
ncbi:endonuclease [Ferrimonas pelagia]|uniref:Endonuclease n=1 Tax=Ferrimonas pelagia TaxID=1177826 RepID=A0ABP9EB28_9GAMM